MKNIWLTCVLLLGALPVLSLDGQLAHYRFERNLEDLSGNGLHLNNGGGVYYANQIFARAAFFSGADDNYATREDAGQFGQGDFSLSMWFYPKQHTGQQILFDTRGYGSPGTQEGISLVIEVENNRWRLIELTADDGEGHFYTIDLPNSWSIYNWYQLTLVYNQSLNRIAIYIDGEQVHEDTTGPMLMDEDNGFTLGASHIEPGGDPLSRGSFFRGYIDEVRLFEVELLESEVAVLAKRETLPAYIDHQVDYVQEGAGASHQMGFFYLDIDTNGDGIPNFFQTGPDDDLDGDLIVNADDWDDDGDNIPDYMDHAGYYYGSGPEAGYAPEASNSVAANYFANGLQAAEAGEHPGDYWQFVPNGIHEQTGTPYEQDGYTYANFYLEPAAYLFVDEYDDRGYFGADGIPDVLQKLNGSGAVPPMALDKGFETVHISGEPFPGLLGDWNQRNGETVFYLCDDDVGTGTSSNYSNYSPYGKEKGIGDIYSSADGNVDYLIYGTTDEWSGQIPYVLNQTDDRGERLWRYRWLGEPVSERREVAYFLTVYWTMGGSPVHTYYTKTVFNDPLRTMPYRNGATSGNDYGLEPGWTYVGPSLPIHWFPAFKSESDHDRLVQAVFGSQYRWRDIATFEDNPVTLSAEVPQAWIDRWENMTNSRPVSNYINMLTAMQNTAVDAVQLMDGRYGTGYYEFDFGNRLTRVEDFRLPHAVVMAFPEAAQTGCLITWEDLYNGGDRDFNDVSFYSTIGASVSSDEETGYDE